jgi:anti-anti-sigma factor
LVAQRVIALTGEIDIYTAAEACRPLDAIDGPAVVDLSDVRLLTAAGLAELARVAKRVGHAKVTLVGAQPHIRRILAITRMDLLFIIE